MEKDAEENWSEVYKKNPEKEKPRDGGALEANGEGLFRD